ncbi:MAG: thioredoxin family protein [Elusimicrobiota bacterium]|nr:thioredoxin family protein [Elusimicrobiota bacterium]
MRKLKIVGMVLICLSFLNISCRDTAPQSGLPMQKTEMASAEKTEATEKAAARNAAVKKAKNAQTTVKKTAPVEKVKATFIELGSVNCVPCKMMAPIVEEIKNEYAGQVRVIFYDVWKPEGRPYGDKYKIRAIPTQVFLDAEGEEYFRHEGYFPKDEIISVLKEAGVN